MTTIVTPRGFRLGKKDPVLPPDLGLLRDYLDESARALVPPAQAHYGHKVTTPWQMDGNGPDPSVEGAPPGWGGCGDCVKTGQRNATATANFWEGGDTEPVPTSTGVVDAYAAAMGCTPEQLFTDPDQYDQGEDMATAASDWRTKGCYGFELPYYVPVGLTEAEIKEALYLGGGLWIGIQLPESAEQQFPHEWTWVPDSEILGGHCVWLTGYDATHVYLITWGQMITATWEFILETIDEAWVLLLPQVTKYGEGAQKIKLAALEADLNKIAVPPYQAPGSEPVTS